MKSHPYLVLASALLAVAGCKSTPPALADTLPVEPGAGACRATTTRGDQVTTTRWVVDGDEIRALVDHTGDGEPDVVITSKLDAERRVVVVETATAGGMLQQREQRSWDGTRLVARRIDKFDADGRPGVDGVVDEVHELHWDGDRLIRETIDQLDANGLLGVDGTPEFVTEWSWENGQRVRGVKTDARDGAVLQTIGLGWIEGHLALTTIDLGGDGSIDLTIQNSWRDNDLVESNLSGTVDNAQTRYEYCL